MASMQTKKLIKGYSVPNSPFINQENIDDSIMQQNDDIRSPETTKRTNNGFVVQNMYVRFRKESRMGLS